MIFISIPHNKKLSTLDFNSSRFPEVKIQIVKIYAFGDKNT